ncbi:TetR/AcrR family transcriptional regulator [Burkholderia stagnalis]
MPKPTKAQIDTEIVDRAAGLFARHGFAHTSLQQIADAVSYTKAGLLYYYPSKQAVYDAVLATGRDQARAYFAGVETLPVGADRDRAVVEASLRFTYDWPGVSAFVNRIVDTEDRVDPDVTEMGFILYAALGMDLQNLDLERVVRVTTAFCGLGMAALQAVRLDVKREWHDHLVASAMNALGY